MPKDLRKPIIEYELVNGQEKILHYFASSAEVVKFYKQATPPLNIWQSLVSLCCNGIVKWAKKHRFRFATPEEIASVNASLKIVAEIKKTKEAEQVTPVFEEPETQDIEQIPAVTEKPVSDDNLTPFERLLRKMQRE